jgi:glucose-6-phosphate-specific signal transduction histidine kinase
MVASTMRRDAMPLWQRLLITVAVMLAASYLVGLVWHWVFNADIPSYLSGAVGGLTAVPTWEFLRRIRPNHQD